MKVMIPKKNESHVGTPNTRITTPVIRPVTAALVGKAMLVDPRANLLQHKCKGSFDGGLNLEIRVRMVGH